MCTLPIVIWFLAVTSYVADVCIHFPYIPIKCLMYIVYMPNLVGICVSSTYLAIT